MGDERPNLHLRRARIVAVAQYHDTEQIRAQEKSPGPEPGAKTQVLEVQVLEVQVLEDIRPAFGVSSRERCLLVPLHGNWCAHQSMRCVGIRSSDGNVVQSVAVPALAQQHVVEGPVIVPSTLLTH